MEQPAPDKGSERTGNDHTYLLRIWRADDGHPWRATLRNTQESAPQHFARLIELFTSLWRQVNRNADKEIV